MGQLVNSLSGAIQLTVTDQLNRPVRDLRISLTDRCQFRCTYCLPAEHVDVMRQQSQSENCLSFNEITAVIKVFARLGVNKIKLTGGEPLLRKNVADLVSDIKSITGIEEVALTTNAGLLGQVLDDLVDAGLDRITISLDALEQTLFEQITGTQFQVEQILNSIDQCLDSKLKKVKVNCVVQKGINENQVIPLLKHFRGTGVVVRFIEYMDVGNLNNWKASEVVNSKDLLDQINNRWPIKPKNATHVGEVADRFIFNDGQGEFGMISSISQPFCHDCNRARLSTRGEIFTCLFANQGHNIKPLLNQPEQLLQAISQIWCNRADQYSALRQKNLKQENKTKKIEMFVIGG